MHQKINHLGLVRFKKMVTHHSVFITHHSSLSFYHSSLITHHSVFITHHSSLITHHLKHPTLFGTITHLSSLNIFQLFVGPIHVPCAAFTLFIYFFSFNFQYPNSMKTESVKKKEKREEEETQQPERRKEKKKKKDKKKKPVFMGQCIGRRAH